MVSELVFEVEDKYCCRSYRWACGCPRPELLLLLVMLVSKVQRILLLVNSASIHAMDISMLDSHECHSWTFGEARYGQFTKSYRVAKPARPSHRTTETFNRRFQISQVEQVFSFSESRDLNVSIRVERITYGPTIFI